VSLLLSLRTRELTLIAQRSHGRFAVNVSFLSWIVRRARSSMDASLRKPPEPATNKIFSDSREDGPNFYSGGPFELARAYCKWVTGMRERSFAKSVTPLALHMLTSNPGRNAWRAAVKREAVDGSGSCIGEHHGSAQRDTPISVRCYGRTTPSLRGNTSRRVADRPIDRHWSI